MVNDDTSDAAASEGDELSSTALLAPRTQLERHVLNLTRAGIDAYRDATLAALAGDMPSARLFSQAGQRALDVAREAADGLDGSREPDDQ
jgi:hypothetical protein